MITNAGGQAGIDGGVDGAIAPVTGGDVRELAGGAGSVQAESLYQHGGKLRSGDGGIRLEGTVRVTGDDVLDAQAVDGIIRPVRCGDVRKYRYR